MVLGGGLQVEVVEDLGEDVPAYCRGLGEDELSKSLPTQTVL